MAVRREAQKRDREARILRAASELFARRGYAATGMLDIARSARLAVGTLYNYFASKSQIAVAIVGRDTEAALRSCEEVLKRPPPDPVRAVQAVLERALAPFVAHDRALCRELVGAALADPTVGQAFFAADLRLIGVVATLLRELEARGDLDEGLDLGRAAICLYGVFFSWLMAYLASDALELARVRSELRAATALVLRGLITREGPPT